MLFIGFNMSYAEAKFLADRHIERGMNCQSCHVTNKMKDVPTQQCLACHGPWSKLIDSTGNKDINPHDSHLEEPKCELCHRGHKKPQLACDECHEFTGMNVP